MGDTIKNVQYGQPVAVVFSFPRNDSKNERYVIPNASTPKFSSPQRHMASVSREDIPAPLGEG
jgi:hypothetical protein